MILPSELTIATRASELAQTQARWIESKIKQKFPFCKTRLLTFTTQGDRFLNMSIEKLGGRGVFVKELEQALLDQRADIAVHSMKDVPIQLCPGCDLIALSSRESPEDALVSNHFASLDMMPAGSVVGTSSLRRKTQLQIHYPHLIVNPLRGNVQTRLAKLDDGDYNGIILASAGLIRLGLSSRIRHLLPVDQFIPAPGQGILGVEAGPNASMLKESLSFLNDVSAALTMTAERTFAKAMGANCSLPLGAFASMNKDQNLQMTVFLSSIDGKKYLQDTSLGSGASITKAQELGEEMADRFNRQGAQELIHQINESSRN